MSEREAVSSETASDDVVLDEALAFIDAALPQLTEALAVLDTPERYLVAQAYILTAIFAVHPHMYEGLLNLLATFAPVYEEMTEQFKVQFPELWAERDDDEVFVIAPSVVKLPTN